MSEKLQKILPGECYVYPSEANFLMVDLGEVDSTKLAVKLLDNNIFIKDLKTKVAFKNKNFIRLAIRTKEENDSLINALITILRDV